MSRQPYDAPDWSLVPGHTAVVLIDLQNDVLSDDGWYAKSGVDISHMQRVIEPTKRLLEGARAKGIPVIWTTHGLHNEIDCRGLLGYPAVSPRRRLPRRLLGPRYI